MKRKLVFKVLLYKKGNNFLMEIGNKNKVY